MAAHLKTSVTPPYNFLALPSPLSSYRTSKTVILPAPYDSTVSYKTGTREGPQAILLASRKVERFDEELGLDISAHVGGIATLGEMMPVMSSPKKMVSEVREAARKLCEDDKLIVLLGGEHSLTLGVVQALREKHPKMGVLQIDAHADLRDEYEGTPFSHACVMRRVRELCPATQVGVRSFSEEESALMAKERLRVFLDKDLAGARAATGKPKWVAEVVQTLPDEVYVTIDLDGLDPAIMPSVGTPEPGGLGWYDTLRLLRAVAQKKRIIGFD
ncbi:MAG: agmatinase, partial [Planctomycetes bacterium]|nr:agmatinase [Planctomycetota bacterium]